MLLYASVMCLRILASLKISRSDLGRWTPNFLGGSVTQASQESLNSVKTEGTGPDEVF
jgi:hypothetical protein